MKRAPFGMTYLPVLPDEDTVETPENEVGVSHTRAGIVAFLREKQIERPSWNIARQKAEVYASIEGYDVPREFVSLV